MIISSAISPANLLGCLSLFTYIFTLLPSCLRISIPTVKKAKFIANLLKYRRQIGILAFLLALVHVVLIIIKRNVDLFDLQTYSISLEGTASLIIFALLAFTSNDWSVKKMKKKLAKTTSINLHSLIFIILAYSRKNVRSLEYINSHRINCYDNNYCFILKKTLARIPKGI